MILAERHQSGTIIRSQAVVPCWLATSQIRVETCRKALADQVIGEVAV